MSSLIPSFLEGSIDFEGQRLADNLTYYFLTASGVFALAAGYFSNNISICVYIASLLFVFGFVLVVFPWPFYNQHPVKFLKP
ncbi:microsomal signal peptidase 12kDa subunit [Dipodascopsis uninucleata]